MKICDISSFYSDRGGGVRTYHHQKLDYFSRHSDHEYCMIVAGPRNEVEQVPGGRIYHVRGVPVSRNGVYRQIADCLEVARVLRLERPDVIEVGSAYVDCWLAFAGSNGWDPLFVGFYHADFPDTYMAPAVAGFPRVISRPFVDFWKRYVRFVYERFDATCVTSRYIEKKLESFGVTNTFRVPLGVDTELFHPRHRDPSFRESLGMKPGDKLALYVGRFWSEKGIDVLAEGVRHYRDRPGLHIVLVGDGTLEPVVRAAANSSPRVHVLGFVHEAERLARIYASADLFLSPGPYETFGLSTLEALSSGVPVVAANNGGVSELVGPTGTWGKLFIAHDPNDFVHCVDQMLEADLPSLGRQARSFVEQSFSWDRTFRRMTDHYAELLHAKRASAGVSARRDPGPRAIDREGVLVHRELGAPASGPRCCA
jgi:alpha-1,6-mannosyltransferase